MPHELAERAGLMRARTAATGHAAKTAHFDMFVDRVVYALTSPMGEVIGFGGRVIDATSDQPKYKNSPETLLYKKGENLFGLHAAKHAIRKGGRALVVEGNFDVMTLHEERHRLRGGAAGHRHHRRAGGAARRFAREVVLMLDADPAGRAATLKVIRLFVDAELQGRRRVAARHRRQEGRSRRPGAQRSAAPAGDDRRRRRTRSSSSSSRWRRRRQPTVPGRVRGDRGVRAAPARRRAIRWRATSTSTGWRSCSRSIAGLVRRALRGARRRAASTSRGAVAPRDRARRRTKTATRRP